jgi:hypothetical protein
MAPKIDRQHLMGHVSFRFSARTPVFAKNSGRKRLFNYATGGEFGMPRRTAVKYREIHVRLQTGRIKMQDT